MEYYNLTIIFKGRPGPDGKRPELHYLDAHNIEADKDQLRFSYRIGKRTGEVCVQMENVLYYYKFRSM